MNVRFYFYNLKLIFADIGVGEYMLFVITFTKSYFKRSWGTGGGVTASFDKNFELNMSTSHSPMNKNKEN
jgi:hypothetical protein